MRQEPCGYISGSARQAERLGLRLPLPGTEQGLTWKVSGTERKLVWRECSKAGGKSVEMWAETGSGTG